MLRYTRLLTIHKHLFTLTVLFRKNFSCITNLLTAADRQTAFLDLNEEIDVPYHGFLKDFDRVSHIYLINELKLLGIKSLITDWLILHINHRHLWSGLTELSLGLWNVLVGSLEFGTRTPSFLALVLKNRFCQI